ncbi:hypothetical protein INT44_007849 [Umbelopsis vinacea]|uniref:Uncharacterized protein n=1 Tax=Umbelopsis vinacea TaxID=44442 RepID=A0A8H7PK24_9FUNG|nr:hypothetical protein INT44_007849 [Umbelopsis vinacea]
MREGFEAINTFKPVAFPDAPDDVANYLSSLSAKATVNLQKQCLNRSWSEIFSRQSDFDLEWANFCNIEFVGTIHAIRMHRIMHSGIWLTYGIWWIDCLMMCYNWKQSEESASISSSFRKNEDCFMSTYSKINRRAMCIRGDLLLQKGMTEYGCAEGDANYDGPNGTKSMSGIGMVARKMLKDMLNNLATMCQKEEARVVQLRTVGYIHSESSMETLTMNANKGYITRLTRSKQYDGHCKSPT